MDTLLMVQTSHYNRNTKLAKKGRHTFQLSVQPSQEVDAEDFSDEFFREPVGHGQGVGQENQQMWIEGALKTQNDK